MEPKKANLFRIYHILEQYSDNEHPLKQQEIIERLEKDYGIECDRKTVGRNVSILKEMGFEIDNLAHDGVYLATKQLENSELRMLIDSVMCSKYFNPRHSKDLIDKLVAMGGVHFKSRVKHIYRDCDWGKSNNYDFMLNVEIADEAIENNKQISFFYNRYGADKELHRTTDHRHLVNPYQMLLQNQHYYLVGNINKYDNITFFRIDKITDIMLLGTTAKQIYNLPNYQNGLNVAELVTTLPYMFGDKRELITFRCEEKMIDDIIEWFGQNIKIVPEENTSFYLVTIKSSPKAMLYWLQQYGSSVEVLEPHILRERLISSLEKTLKLYKN